ncbi:MAG: type II toxin-antitoxin system RelE/ParE family toxin [Deltaproteobacteria bacterium]|nr:type II toxin-antitoxin system RelE/ParE family toxin [Deltaproteobacteria bacterium]
MSFQVILTQDAEDDIFGIYKYILEHDSAHSADYVLEKLEELCHSLDRLPKRGHTPPELLRINVKTYFEVHFKPYRIIYEIEGNRVFIHCVLDGRRDLQDLLERRLLR